MDLDFASIGVFVFALGGFFSLLAGCLGIARTSRPVDTDATGQEIGSVTEEIIEGLKEELEEETATIAEANNETDNKTRLSKLAALASFGRRR